jgi:hypothetical protein
MTEEEIRKKLAELMCASAGFSVDAARPFREFAPEGAAARMTSDESCALIESYEDEGPPDDPDEPCTLTLLTWSERKGWEEDDLLECESLTEAIVQAHASQCDE